MKKVVEKKDWVANNERFYSRKENTNGYEIIKLLYNTFMKKIEERNIIST